MKIISNKYIYKGHFWFQSEPLTEKASSPTTKLFVTHRLLNFNDNLHNVLKMNSLYRNLWENVTCMCSKWFNSV